jgi:hypothetical protein
VDCGVWTVCGVWSESVWTLVRMCGGRYDSDSTLSTVIVTVTVTSSVPLAK